MKQIVQNTKTGQLAMVEVPAPTPGEGQVLVRNHFSVVSPGTEKMAMEFARKSLLAKARSRPDLVKQVIRKFRQEGPLSTYRAVTQRLDALQPLGYSCAGVVELVGQEVTGFAPGDRVACAGAGYANHAEFVCVPENLVVRVPDTLPLEKAAFCTLGAIALQGLRVANPTLGEIAVVIGLGVIGQLTVQLLHANGCRVLAIDLNPERVKQALAQGAEWGTSPEDDHSLWRDHATQGYGADFVIVTASSESSAPIQLAAELCRTKGRVVAVGATALELDRRTFYEKELELRMSMSYGPGRYDSKYEETGLDYPISYVRWTENRNLQAFAKLTTRGSIDPSKLDIREIPFAEAEHTYSELASGELAPLAIRFRYDSAAPRQTSVALATCRASKRKDEVGIAFIGAGNYAKGVLLPIVATQKGIRSIAIATTNGSSARKAAENFGYARCTTDPQEIFSDPDVDLVFIATRHDSHSVLAQAALKAGKAVWLEKPAGVTPEQVDSLIKTAHETGGFLALGYNRRFSAHARSIRTLLTERAGAVAIHYRVAAGPIPRDTWLLDSKQGGGRIVGEACHFIDLCMHLVGMPPTTVYAQALGRNTETDDSMVCLLHFSDGSVATIHYLTHADPRLPKEHFEVSGNNQTAVCDNYRITTLNGVKTIRTFRQDKGQQAMISAVLAAIKNGKPSPFALLEIAAVFRATTAIQESINSGKPIPLDLNEYPGLKEA